MAITNCKVRCLHTILQSSSARDIHSILQDCSSRRMYMYIHPISGETAKAIFKHSFDELYFFCARLLFIFLSHKRKSNNKLNLRFGVIQTEFTAEMMKGFVSSGSADRVVWWRCFQLFIHRAVTNRWLCCIWNKQPSLTYYTLTPTDITGWCFRNFQFFLCLKYKKIVHIIKYRDIKLLLLSKYLHILD